MTTKLDFQLSDYGSDFTYTDQNGVVEI